MTTMPVVQGPELWKLHADGVLALPEELVQAKEAADALRKGMKAPEEPQLTTDASDAEILAWVAWDKRRQVIEHYNRYKHAGLSDAADRRLSEQLKASRQDVLASIVQAMNEVAQKKSFTPETANQFNTLSALAHQTCSFMLMEADIPVMSAEFRSPMGGSSPILKNASQRPVGINDLCRKASFWFGKDTDLHDSLVTDGWVDLTAAAAAQEPVKTPDVLGLANRFALDSVKEVANNFKTLENVQNPYYKRLPSLVDDMISKGKVYWIEGEI